MRVLVFAAVLCVAGCRSGRTASGPRDAGSAVGQVAELPAGTDDGGYRVDPTKLDRFITYQQRTLELYAQSLAAQAREKTDGGLPSPAAMARIREQAAEQERLRAELGLTERDVRELDQVVGDVISRRAQGGENEDEDSIRQMKALAESLPEEQRAEFEATIAALEKQQQALRSLDEERRRYGDENVNRVLAREAELTRNWNQAIATFAGATSRAAPRATPQAPDAGVPDAGDR